LNNSEPFLIVVDLTNTYPDQFQSLRNFAEH
jgi:hypothetical protein